MATIPLLIALGCAIAALLKVRKLQAQVAAQGGYTKRPAHSAHSAPSGAEAVEPVPYDTTGGGN